MKPTALLQDDLLTLRFTGDTLKERSLPIYELGNMLIAIQRIIHKTALYEKGRLEKGARLEKIEREEAALQIVTHRKGSDLWGFAPYLSNAAYGPILQGLVVAGLSAVAAYVWKKVRREEKPPDNQLLIVNIFPQIRSITDRIDNIGGVSEIEISSPTFRNRDPLLISSDTQQYVTQIANQTFPGKRTTIIGYVTRLYPQSFRLDVEDTRHHYVHVHMTEALFEKVRVLPKLEGHEITFEGVPFYRLGDIGSTFEEFHADGLIQSGEKK